MHEIKQSTQNKEVRATRSAGVKPPFSHPETLATCHSRIGKPQPVSLVRADALLGFDRAEANGPMAHRDCNCELHSQEPRMQDSSYCPSHQ